MSSNKILAIALDAAEPSLIEKWMDEGGLKNLSALRSKGAYGRLATSAEWLAGSPWPTLYTSTLPGKHGFYHYIQWKSDKMDYERPNPDWIPGEPFFRKMGNNIKVIAVDMPLTYPPKKFNGIEISGWASHDKLYPMSSYPEDKINWVRKNFGSPPISDEVGGLQPVDELLKVRDELIEASRKEGELVSKLIKDEEWDLFLCCFTSTHRGGHKLFDTTNIKGEYSEDQEVQFKNSLMEIYQSCDDVIGNILKNIDENVIVFVYSLHGMGPNTTLADNLLPKMISAVLNGKPETKKKKANFIKNLRSKVPLEWRSNLRKLLPLSLQDYFTTYWRMGGINWAETKAFCLVADLQGYIRINLKGREKKGIVEKKEYDLLCEKIINGLKTFKDAGDSESVIEDIKRSDQVFKPGNGFDNLPDILVKWRQKQAANYTKIFSDQFGGIEFPTPGFNPDGRSGNHLYEGFVLAAGKSIRHSVLGKKHILDLAPTILHLLGAEIPAEYEGKVIKEIFEEE